MANGVIVNRHGDVLDPDPTGGGENAVTGGAGPLPKSSTAGGTNVTGRLKSNLSYVKGDTATGDPNVRTDTTTRSTTGYASPNVSGVPEEPPVGDIPGDGDTSDKDTGDGTGDGGQKGTGTPPWTEGFPTSLGVDLTDPMWNDWRRNVAADGTIIYKEANAENIVGFLRSIFAGKHNIGGLEAAEPYLQWFFGPGVSIVRRDDGTAYDSLNINGQIIDVIQGASRGGEAWQWLPDSEAGTASTTTTTGTVPPANAQATQSSWRPPWMQWGGWPTPPAGYTPREVPMDPLSTYTPYGFDLSPLPAYNPYQYGDYPFSTYTPGNVDQFLGQDQSGINALQTQSIQDLLSNPLLSEQAINQLKAQQKETILTMGQQLGQQAAQRAATQGTFGGGGYASNMADVQAGQIGDITSAYRDISLQATDLNRRAQEGALSASEEILRGQLNRQIDAYKTRLEGQDLRERYRLAGVGTEQDRARFLRETDQLRNEEERRRYEAMINSRDWVRRGQFAQADEDYRGFETQRASEMDQIQRFLSQEGLNQAGAQSWLDNYLAWTNAVQGQRGLDLNRYLGTGGLWQNAQDFDLRRTIAQNNQNNWILNFLSGGGRQT